jgi:predicted dehydrogenase
MHAQSPDLAIESEAQAEIIFTNKNGAIGHIHLDYLKPKYERSCEILGTKGLIKWNDLDGKAFIVERGSVDRILFKNPEGYERNTMFVNHMSYFCERLKNNSKVAASSFSDSLKVLKAALAAHFANKNSLTVNLERESTWQQSV